MSSQLHVYIENVYIIIIYNSKLNIIGSLPSTPPQFNTEINYICPSVCYM